MKPINLSSTAQEILTVYFANPGQKFYVNELIRKTGKYPNSIQQALKSLEKQKILLSSRCGRFKLHALNQSYKFLPEIEGILRKNRKITAEFREKKQKPVWIKTMNRRGSIPFVTSWLESIFLELPRIIPVKQESGWHNSLTGGVYQDELELEETGKVLKRLFEEKSDFTKKTSDKLKEKCQKLLKVGRKIRRINLTVLTKKELHSLLKSYRANLLQLLAFLPLPLSLETYIEEEIKNSLYSFLKEKRQDKDENKFSRFLEVFTSPVILDRQQEDEALQIADYVRRYGWNQRAKIIFEKYAENYRWLPFEAEIGKFHSDEYFKDKIDYLVKKFKNPLGEIKKNKKLEEDRKKELKNSLSKIKASKDFIDKVSLLQNFIVLRTYRNRLQAKANYFHFPLIYEIAYRMEISDGEIKYLTYDEMLSWLKHGHGRKFGHSYEGLKKEITRRMSGWAVLMWRGKVKIVTGVKNIIETMERYRIVAPGPLAVKVVKGNPACRGRATGRVKIVRKLSELDKVKEGDILVAKMTTPDYMVAIHKAAAMVTDEGGVTCHAAIVSREFNVPCIVGTKNATSTLSDNDLVEVDASEGVVRVIEAVEVDENIKEIYGKTAYKGKVRGLVRVVLDANDFPKVKEGDILIAPQTTPEYLSSLYKVKGFIVDEESITSHAMLYAKALKLPCVIGTQFARNFLKDGEKIELDATRGVVKRLI